MTYQELREKHLPKVLPDIDQLEAPPFRFGRPRILNAATQRAFIDKVDNEHTDALRKFLLET